MAESAKFTIGGEERNVPALRFIDLEEMKTHIIALGPNISWIDYSGHVLRIVAHQLGVPYMDLAEKCSVRETQNLAEAMNELLRVSGFDLPGEPLATEESPGTGTLTSSPPNSPPTESSGEISTQ